MKILGDDNIELSPIGWLQTLTVPAIIIVPGMMALYLLIRDERQKEKYKRSKSLKPYKRYE